jgi:hypothetical protein
MTTDARPLRVTLAVQVHFIGITDYRIRTTGKKKKKHYDHADYRETLHRNSPFVKNMFYSCYYKK